MRSNGRRLDFLGLTGNMLGDGEARLLADALNALPGRQGRDHRAQTGPSVRTVRDQLTKAGTRAGVEVLLSLVNGPALRIR